MVYVVYDSAYQASISRSFLSSVIRVRLLVKSWCFAAIVNSALLILCRRPPTVGALIPLLLILRGLDGPTLGPEKDDWPLL